MWELTGKIKDFVIDVRTNSAILSFSIGERQDAADCFDNLSSAPELTIKLDKRKKKRSFDANAYFWVLAGKLSAVTGIRKEEIYRREIKEIGGNSETVCVKAEAAEKLRSGWEHNGLGWVTDIIPSRLDGCVNVVLYYGSSTYDTSQMSRLVENIVQECKTAGIQVMTPDKITDMLNRWEHYEKHHTK